MQNIWNGVDIPKDWLTSLLTPIYKKGDKENCASYRGITIINTAIMILEKFRKKDHNIKKNHNKEVNREIISKSKKYIPWIHRCRKNFRYSELSKIIDNIKKYRY